MHFSRQRNARRRLSIFDFRRRSDLRWSWLMTLLLPVASVLAQPYQSGVSSRHTGFVPESAPLSESDIANIKAQWKRTGGSNEALTHRLRMEHDRFTYRDEDIRAAVEGLDADDIRITLCSSMFGDLFAFTYRGEVGQNRLTIKDVFCRPADGGLTCHSARESKYFFVESPQQYFSLAKVPLDEAKAVIAAYKQGGVADLPEDLKKFSYKAVRSIRAVPDGYELSLGGMSACGGGCVFTIIVRLERTDDGIGQLKLVRVSDGMCV